MNFEILVDTIQATSIHFQQNAVKAININVTIRNWLIGLYIVEFEQNGEDRAKYGAKLLQKLASRINQDSLSFRNLKLFRQFYLEYPQIGQTLYAQLKSGQFPFDSLPQTNLLIDKSLIRQTPSAQLQNQTQLPADKLISALSFSHFVVLLPVKETLKRTFYEIEAIKGTWSVNELKRQVNSLYFERSGMSLNPEKLSDLTNVKAEKFHIKQAIKSPFVFEFLGLKAKETIEEKDLEAALIDHLQDFILELGEGFCFESRQKRIVIDEEYYFVDLVFYHRILKCHILVELKADSFKPEHASQLNTYVAYYNAEVKRKDDNPTIGILLCTEKGTKLVEYALAGMDQNLFVSKYLVELPSQEVLARFVEIELKKM